MDKLRVERAECAICRRWTVDDHVGLPAVCLDHRVELEMAVEAILDPAATEGMIGNP